MNKSINLIFFLVFILVTACSFDSKTGIWDGDKDEKRKISELEKRQKKKIDIYKVFTSYILYANSALTIKLSTSVADCV